MNNELAIKVENLSKRYRLGTIGGGSLQADLQSKWARFRNREDPNSKIGESTAGKQSFFALNNINFSIKKGERVGLIGGNGAGKSTTLKILSHVTAPTSGAVYMNGRIASMLEVGTGFHPELTGRENIYLNGAILGMTKKEVDKKIDSIIEFSECGQFIDTPVKRYSSGMYVKLAFSVAAHLDSEIVIMDEVLAVGDAAFQKKCLEKMKKLSEEDGRTIIYVSHNMNTVRQLCDRCIVLNKGSITYDGPVEKGIQHYLGSQQVSSNEIDFSEFPRKQSLKPGITIKNIKSHNGWKIQQGNEIEFDILFESTIEDIDVGFRSRISTIDESSITVLLAPDLVKKISTGLFLATMRADISQLVPGKYCLTPVLYSVNEFGGWNFYDHLEQAITFEILERQNFNQSMEWNTKYWGHVTFPDLEVIAIEKKNLKIAIVSIFDVKNYGNRLQSYALTNFLKSEYSIDAVALTPIDFFNSENRDLISIYKEKISVQLCRSYGLSKRFFSDQYILKARFQLFNSKIDQKYYPSDKNGYIINDLNEYNAFFAGSDQIWNYNFSAPFFNNYFLEFAPESKRYAIAASIGAPEIPLEFQNYYRKSLLKFRNISVREDNANRLIKEISNRSSAVICDPVIMITPNEWKKISSKPSNLPENYVFLHLLANSSDFPASLHNLLKSENTIRIGFSKNPDVDCAGPMEFLGLIINASQIITDSFHCFMFALIFNKPVKVFLRSDLDMKSRFDTALRMFDIKESKDDGVYCEINEEDYPLINKRIEEQRQIFRNYIENVIDTIKSENI